MNGQRLCGAFAGKARSHDKSQKLEEFRSQRSEGLGAALRG